MNMWFYLLSTCTVIETKACEWLMCTDVLYAYHRSVLQKFIKNQIIESITTFSLRSELKPQISDIFLKKINWLISLSPRPDGAKTAAKEGK